MTEVRAIDGLRHVTLLNLEPQLCGPKECSFEKDGIRLYSDEMHLSVPGSRTLTSVFARAISEHVKVQTRRTRDQG